MPNREKFELIAVDSKTQKPPKPSATVSGIIARKNAL
jgi:hypothetical protein